jgi:hypothetical protein
MCERSTLMSGLGDGFRDSKRTFEDDFGEEIDTVAYPFGIRGRHIPVRRSRWHSIPDTRLEFDPLS